MSDLTHVTVTREPLKIALRDSERLPDQLDRFIRVMRQQFDALAQENQRLREGIVASASRRREIAKMHREQLADISQGEVELRDESARLLKEAESIEHETEVRG